MCTGRLAVPVVVWVACGTHFFLYVIFNPNVKLKLFKPMTIECPKCGSEDAFFNGVCYECPTCDYEWEADNCEFEEEE